MLRFIDIDGVPFSYEEQKLFHGRKVMNLEIARENLEIFYSVIKQTSIRYGLIFGTLLGAVRENNFIAHDEDTDLFVLSEDLKPFLELLPEFNKRGLQVIRYSNGILSLMRNNEYIDVYFFEKVKKIGLINYRSFNGNYEILGRYMENTITHDFLGMEISIPSFPEKVLKRLYGADWRIPKKNSFAEPKSLKSKIKKIVPSFLLDNLNQSIKDKFKILFSKF